jgi:hypothetical protein
MSELDDSSYFDFVRLARRFDGATLSTQTGKRFRVEVESGVVYFTPDSTGLRRSTSPSATEEVLQRYRQSGSLRASDYSDITRNASYFVALLRRR